MSAMELTTRLEELLKAQVPAPGMPYQDNPFVEYLKSLLARLEAIEAA